MSQSGYCSNKRIMWVGKPVESTQVLAKNSLFLFLDSLAWGLTRLGSGRGCVAFVFAVFGTVSMGNAVNREHAPSGYCFAQTRLKSQTSVSRDSWRVFQGRRCCDKTYKSVFVLERQTERFTQGSDFVLWQYPGSVALYLFGTEQYPLCDISCTI